VYIERFGEETASFITGFECGVFFHSLSDGSVVSRCVGAESDLGVFDVACDTTRNLFVAGFREGRVRAGLIIPARWLASMHFPDPIVAVRLDGDAGRIWVADDGGSRSNWPAVHELTFSLTGAEPS
jgi:hypothetical protein